MDLSLILVSCDAREKVASNLEGTLAVVASETGFVIDLVVSSELIHQIHCLLTCFALLGSPCK